MKRLSRIVSVLLVLCMILSLIPSVFAADDTVDFAFLVTSDIHGKIYATDYSSGVEKSGTYRQGLTRVASYIKKMKAEYGDNLYTVDMGDTIQGEPLTYWYAFNKPEEQPAIKAFRTIGYDMWLLGNHEFNYGMTILDKEMNYATSASTETEKQLVICDANYLDANTNNAETKDWKPYGNIKPYVIQDFDGVKVAIIGLSTPNIPKWDGPENWKGFYFESIYTTYKHYEEEMKSKADMIVVMAHTGINSEMADPSYDSIRYLVEHTDSIDFVFSGHEHGTRVNDIQNSKGETIKVLQPGTKAALISQVKVSYNKTTKESTIVAENIDMKNYAFDEATVNTLKSAEENVWNNYMLKKIGSAADDFTASGLGTGPSAFMDLINKVQIWGAYDNTGKNTPEDKTDDAPAQLSISAPLTSGNNANLIAKGDIFLGDLFALYRYENWFYQLTMTGKEIRTWLEYSASKLYYNQGKIEVAGGLTYYDVIYGDGFSYKLDPNKPEGERVVEMTYNDAAVKDTDEFTIVMNNYRFTGGGNYVNYCNEHGCDLSDLESRIIYSTQYDMIKGEDDGQARTLLQAYIENAGEAGIEPTITSTWSVAEKSTVELEIFETTDIHGYLVDTSSGSEDTFQYRMAYISNVIKAARRAAENDGVILLDSGDIYQGTPVSNLTYGNALRAAFDKMGYDAVSLGNHEFDWDVKTYAADNDGTMPSYEIGDYKGDSTIPVLAYDLIDNATGSRASFVQEYVILNKGGLKVAVIGYIPDYSMDIMAAKINPYTIDKSLEKLNAKIDKVIADETPDILLVLAHDSPKHLAEALDPEKVDLVLGGHSHQTACGVTKAGLAYMQGNCQAQGYANTKIVYDKTTKKVTVEKPTYVSITGNKSALYDTEANAAKLDQDIVAISKASWNAVKGTMSEVLGTVDQSIYRRKNIGDSTNTIAGNWLTGLMLKATKEQNTVAAFTNSGGIRCDLLMAEGATSRDITVGDIYTISPFGNRWYVYDLTGAELAKTVELSFTNANYGDQMSGILVKYIKEADTVDENGKINRGAYKVTSITLDDGTKVDITDNKKTYRVVTNEYCATLPGSVYEKKTPVVDVNEAPADNDAIIATLRAESKVNNGKIVLDLTERCTYDYTTPFTDVKGEWYTPYVEDLYARGLINGMTSTTFEPETELTRGMFATLLWRAAGEPAVEEPSTFTDVDAKQYYSTAIAWAQDAKVVNGVTPTTFVPDASITREEMVTMLYRVVGEEETDADLTKFSDANTVSEYAVDAMKWAVSVEVIQGDRNGTTLTLDPQGNTTRAEAAAVLSRFVNLMAKG